MAAHGPSTVAAILVAAGSGERLGADVPKAFTEVEGRTLLAHAAERFVVHRAVGSLVVVAPPARCEQAGELIDDLTAKHARFTALLANSPLGTSPTSRPPLPPTDVQVVAGGATRQLSVSAGLAALTPEVEFVLVHDVARAFAPRRVITTVLDALHAGADAAVPVMPVHDTIRRVGAGGEFVGVIDRSALVAVQTPQGFRRTVLDAAHAAGADLAVTDDAALVEAIGGTVVAVPGSDASFKITRPWDLIVADALAESDRLGD